MCIWIRFFAAVCVGLVVLWAASSHAAELKVFSDIPLRTPLVRIVADFRAETNHSVDVVYGTAPALKAKLAAGEKADVLISLAAEIEEMAKSNKFAATQFAFASIKIGLAVRDGVAVPDIKTLDAFKQALLRADTIIYNNLATGRAFAKQLERIGIAEQLKSKTVLVGATPVLVELINRKGNDIAAGPLPLIIDFSTKGIQLVGPVPQEVQSETAYAAGVFADTKSLDAARAFIQFLISPKATAAFVAVGAK